MVAIATVCQAKVSLMLLLDGLCNGAKTISVQLEDKKNYYRLEDHLKTPGCDDTGKTDVASNFLNYFAILGKLHIWKSRKNSTQPSLGLFKEIVKVKFRT